MTDGRLVTTCAASHVLIGTDATRPIEPTSARTISVATISRVATPVIDSPTPVKSSSNGSAAPAYARNSVFTVDEMWSRPIFNALVNSVRRPGVGPAPVQFPHRRHLSHGHVV